MKLILIDPPGPVKGFNSGLGYISSFLCRIKTLNIQVIDLNNNPYGSKERIAKLGEIKPGVIGISLKSHTLKPAVGLLGKYKAPGTLIVAGGPEVTLEKENFLSENRIFDYCFVGEAEKSLPDFIECLIERRDISGIRGLCYRDKSGAAILNNPDSIENLDELPFPNYSFFDSVGYIREKYPLVTSRGCAYKCSYCAVGKVSGMRWRFRSPGHVVEELLYARKNYKINKFEIVDDNFTMDIGRAKEICRLIINKKLALRWTCINGIRADRTDDELFKLMHLSGCEDVWFGIETLNKEVFERIHKGEKIEAIITAIELAKKNKIAVSGFFIIGLPGSTFRTDNDSLAMSKKLKLEEALWSLATPLPFTEMANWAEKNAKILRDYREISFYKSAQPVFETPDYSEKERIGMFYKSNIASHCYSAFFSERIKMRDILRFILILIRYNFSGIFGHMTTILFRKSHRKYINEALRRIKN
jgi:radical SAM superfamily enzyme YgiQ (UPF0313 family)